MAVVNLQCALMDSSEDYGVSSIGYADILVSVSSSTGLPISGLVLSDFKFALYNPFGNDLTTMTSTSFPISPEPLAGFYRVGFRWTCASSWQVAGKNHIWQGPYNGTYKVALVVQDSAKKYNGQTAFSFPVVHV